MNYTHLTAAPSAVADRFVASADMKVGAYILDATAPTFGARHVTCTRTVAGNADTPGTLVLVGKDLSGNTITETLTVGAHTVLVTGTKFFASLTSATGAGWVVDVGTTTKDTLEIGWDAINAVAVGGGVLHSLTINTAAAGAIVIADSRGTIATIPSNQAAGSHFVWDVAWSGYLRVEPAAASNITICHSPGVPTYATA